MSFARKVIAFLLCCSLVALADGNSFDKVRYNGGSISSKVSPDDWGNKLTVNADAIVLTLKDGQSVSIPPKQVTSLSYGQEAHRRVGTAVGLAVISLGVGALFALHKTKLHYIGVNYADADGKKQGILLQGDKSNFRAIIVALQGVTGAPVSVAEKERGEVPAGITIQTVKESDAGKTGAGVTTNAAASSDTDAPESLALSSNPDGAEVYVDDAFVGNAPATLKLKPGKHTIRVTQSGYKPWSREVAAQAGTEAHMSATLEKN